ncbi:MAG TPA: ABC transporter substrate-binding protein [Ectothiorhodospiraceae bacterium]|nr:ABC transporter substrate-binding protein [Ectothiorhodospiraceae bacterium]
MRRLVFILSLLILPVLSHAATYADLQRSGIMEPAQVLRTGIETLTSYMEQNRNPEPAKLAHYLEQNIAPYFDFKRMATWAAGPSYRYMSKQQRAQLVLSIKSDFMGVLAKRLTGYSGSRIEYLRPRGNLARGKVILGVKIHTGNGYPLRLDFKLYHGKKGWKVYDVVANGASAVSHYRNDFVRQFRQQRVMARSIR